MRGAIRAGRHDRHSPRIRRSPSARSGPPTRSSDRRRVGNSELAGKLVRHRDNYKLVVDTLRILIANIVADLAATLGPRLPRPAEAKKTLDNLLSSATP